MQIFLEEIHAKVNIPSCRASHKALKILQTKIDNPSTIAMITGNKMPRGQGQIH